MTGLFNSVNRVERAEALPAAPRSRGAAASHGVYPRGIRPAAPRSRGVASRFACAPSGARRRGLTLLEVILSMTLILLMMSGIFGFYHTVLRVRQEGSALAQDVLLTRAILDRIAEEVRHATDIVPGDGVGFRGTRNSITIVRTRMPDNYSYNEYDDTVMENLPDAQLDLMRISYMLRQDPEEVDEENLPIVYGLFRIQKRIFNPNPDVLDACLPEEVAEEVEGEEQAAPPPMEFAPCEVELYAPEIKYLRFQYFDGMEWRDQWQTTDELGGVDMGKAASTGKATYALPQAVMITIGRVRVDPDEEKLAKEGSEEDEEDEIYHPDRFTTVVHVLQADPSLITSRKYGVADQLGRSSEE